MPRRSGRVYRWAAIVAARDHAHARRIGRCAMSGPVGDLDRAMIVGSRTFGRGSVREPLWPADGSATELTVGRYRTPGGRSLDGSGIEPDVAVNPDRPHRKAERHALTIGRGLPAVLPTKDRG
jgi:carboxyl-terminal processing protease